MRMRKDIKIILASGSPRRIQMMHDKGFDPIILPSSAEENDPVTGGGRETVMYLALKKALDVAEKYKTQHDSEDNASEGTSKSTQSGLIIAADTLVLYNNEIMGKPVDFDDGFRMLSLLKGKVHEVVTGVCLYNLSTERKHVFCEETRVHFKDYSDEELTEYLKTDEAYDKAGGYAIQGRFSKYIEGIEGDYNNVVGFPWDRIEKEIEIFLGGSK